MHYGNDSRRPDRSDRESPGVVRWIPLVVPLLAVALAILVYLIGTEGSLGAGAQLACRQAPCGAVLCFLPRSPSLRRRARKVCIATSTNPAPCASVKSSAWKWLRPRADPWDGSPISFSIR